VYLGQLQSYSDRFYTIFYWQRTFSVQTSPVF
jgi:hypothetical protein